MLQLFFDQMILCQAKDFVPGTKLERLGVSLKKPQTFRLPITFIATFDSLEKG